MKQQNEMREALLKIAKLANAAVATNGHSPSSNGDQSAEDLSMSCSIKSLPDRLQTRASETAVKINPVNAPNLQALAGTEFAAAISDPQSLTLLTSKYWGSARRVLAVSFMESTPRDLQLRILSHMNAWARTTCISFVLTAGVGQVRISRNAGGYYSYLGTDILMIPRNRQTMNLQGFTMSTPESEYKRVVRHETGHTLGFPHEHMRREIIARIDPAKAYDYFWRQYGWNSAMVDAQVLTPLDVRTIIGTPADQTSIMCYQLPGSITRDGRPIPGGLDINATDFAFAGRVYPRVGFDMSAIQGDQNDMLQQHDDAQLAEQDSWPDSDDVQDEQVEQVAQETLA
jgi:hypothetical protein